MLRISTVVDAFFMASTSLPFGSAKNFYCCRYFFRLLLFSLPLEVLRISTVVDHPSASILSPPLEVLRISTVVDAEQARRVRWPLEVLRISTVVDGE